jgi:hypothetical protein
MQVSPAPQAPLHGSPTFCSNGSKSGGDIKSGTADWIKSGIGMLGFELMAPSVGKEPSVTTPGAAPPSSVAAKPSTENWQDVASSVAASQVMRVLCALPSDMWF